MAWTGHRGDLMSSGTQAIKAIDQTEEGRIPPRSAVAERLAWFAVLVAGLGYFVDVFDMWLFANFRVKSLTSLGIQADQLTVVGASLINWQQFGFLLGGVLWGILGDKRGRASVMFASILLYSVANVLNAFVTTIPQYAALRFITGFGLAGEIGAGITLISELLPRGKRGYGTTLVTGLGVSGAIAAAQAGAYLDWRHAYIIGGIGGLVLLFLRFMVHESGLYNRMENHSGIKRGSLKLLFSTVERSARFIACVFAGVPIYLTFGILATFSPEIAAAIGIKETLTVPDVMLYASVGITIGDVFAGLMSQFIRSRRLPMALFAAVGAIGSMYIARGGPSSAQAYCYVVGISGICTGYWACLITTAAEQFGTNLRATVTTMVPNLVRASTIFLTTLFIGFKPAFGVLATVTGLTIGVYILTFMALLAMKESYHTDLDYIEAN